MSKRKKLPAFTSGLNSQPSAPTRARSVILKSKKNGRLSASTSNVPSTHTEKPGIQHPVETDQGFEDLGHANDNSESPQASKKARTDVQPESTTMGVSPMRTILASHSITELLII